MNYLIFNDASLPYSSISNARNKFMDTFKILELAQKSQLKSIRIAENNANWFNVELVNEYSIQQWIKDQGMAREMARKLNGILSKTNTPYIPIEELIPSERYALSEFKLNIDRTIATHALGAAYLLETAAISCESNIFWSCNNIDISHYELTEAESSREHIEVVSVDNIFDQDSWTTFIYKQQVEYQSNAPNLTEIWNNRFKLYPNLIFLEELRDDFINKGCSNTVLSKLRESLKELNNYCNTKGFCSKLGAIPILLSN